MGLQVSPENAHDDDACFLIIMKERHGDACILKSIIRFHFWGYLFLWPWEALLFLSQVNWLCLQLGTSLNRDSWIQISQISADTLGSLAGAYANYYGARYIGRPLILKYGKYNLIPPEKFHRVERFFLRHVEISTFIGRLLPIVRHLISIPAGLFGMNHLRFSMYTLLGAFIWCSVLTWIRYLIGQNQDLIMAYSKQAVIWAVAGSYLLVAVYIVFHQRRAGGLSATAEIKSPRK